VPNNVTLQEKYKKGSSKVRQTHLIVPFQPFTDSGSYQVIPPTNEDKKLERMKINLEKLHNNGEITEDEYKIGKSMFKILDLTD